MAYQKPSIEDNDKGYDSDADDLVEQKYTLGSPDVPCTYEELEKLHPNDRALKGFRLELQKFLKVAIPAWEAESTTGGAVRQPTIRIDKNATVGSTVSRYSLLLQASNVGF